MEHSLDSLNSVIHITIHASLAKVWKALITPEIIKQYLFGTEVHSDWKEGSSITYSGVWDGKAYEDKGIILKIIPERILSSTYWSSMSGLEDIAQNYKKVTYELTVSEDGTIVTLTQDGNTSLEDKEHSEQNWTMVLGKLKEIVEA